MDKKLFCFLVGNLVSYGDQKPLGVRSMKKLHISDGYRIDKYGDYFKINKSAFSFSAFSNQTSEQTVSTQHKRVFDSIIEAF